MSNFLHVLNQIWLLARDTAWPFVVANPELSIAIAGSITGGLCTRIVPWVWRQLKRKPQPLQPDDTFPFEVIAPHSDNVLQRLLGNTGDKADDPLANFNIPYQRRQAERDIRKELKRLLTDPEKGWVLILGKTGLGKSREAAQVAKSLNDDGWTILKLKPLEWNSLSARSKLPTERIGTDSKLLFLFDDLNRPMYQAAQRKKLAKSEEAKLVAEPLPKRLLEFLQAFELGCRRENIRVIATARNESFAERPNEPSELDKLELDKHPLWNRFEHYDLAEPEVGALIELMQVAVPIAGIEANAEEYYQLAKSSDRTFRIVVNNLRDARSEGLSLSPQTFVPTLQGNWEKHYRRAIKQYPGSPYIYAAVRLLRSVSVTLTRFTVAPTAYLIADRNRPWWIRWWTHWQIDRALNYLVAAENILNPSDGQIEASQQSVEISNYIQPLLRLLLELADRYSSHRGKMMFSLRNFGFAVYELGHYPQALVALDKALNLANPLLKAITTSDIDSSLMDEVRDFLSSVWFGKGNVLYFLGRLEQAISSYDQAIAIQPNDHQAWHNRGLTLDELERYQEAVDSYDQAIAINPDKDEAWSNRGIALRHLGRYQEALASYDKAIAINPDDPDAWYNRSNALRNLGRYQEVVDSYEKVIAINPKDHRAWSNRGIALANLNRYQEALASYDNAIAINPDDPDVWLFRGFSLGDLERYEEALESYDKAIAVKPDYYQTWYFRGLALHNLGRNEEAVKSYEHAIVIKPDDYQALYGQASALHNLGRNEEAVKSYEHVIALNPDDHQAWNNRGIALSNLGRYEQAMESFDKAIDIKPDYSNAYYSKACCHGLQDNAELAVQALQKAIDLDPTYRERAKTDSDFDAIRHDPRFVQLIGESEGNSSA